jgi:5-formyltetrahydrofolate cyclo-ligase
MPKYDKYCAKWKANVTKCSKHHATCKVTVPKCRKYHACWFQTVASTRQMVPGKKTPKNPKPEAEKIQKLFYTV